MQLRGGANRANEGQVGRNRFVFQGSPHSYTRAAPRGKDATEVSKVEIANTAFRLFVKEKRLDLDSGDPETASTSAATPPKPAPQPISESVEPEPIAVSLERD